MLLGVVVTLRPMDQEMLFIINRLDTSLQNQLKNLQANG